MRQMGLIAKIRAKKAYRQPAMGEISEHLLKRLFTAQKPSSSKPTGGIKDVTDKGALPQHWVGTAKKRRG